MPLLCTEAVSPNTVWVLDQQGVGTLDQLSSSAMSPPLAGDPQLPGLSFEMDDS